MAEGYIPKVPDVRVGTFPASCPANSYVDYDITFDTPFNGTPHVFLDNYAVPNSAIVQNNISYGVRDISNTGFTVRIANNTNNNTNPSNGYVAILF